MFKNYMLGMVLLVVCIAQLTACTEKTDDLSTPTASPHVSTASEKQSSDDLQTSEKSLDPRNLTYQLENLKYTLKDGKVFVKADPAEGYSGENPGTTVTLSEQIKGNLNDQDGDDYAVVLDQDPPGSVRELFFAAVVDGKPTNTISLGDRPLLESITIEDKKIKVIYRDPFSLTPVPAPSEAPQIKKVYIVNDKLELEEVK